MIKTILFDLDGTLLPMDQEVFIKSYFKRLAAKLAPRGYESRKLFDCIWAGTEAMVVNDGSCTNEEAFWKKFASAYGEQVMEDIPLFEEYYANEFQTVKEDCGFNPQAKELVDRLKREGYRLVLATNPLFPRIATESRIRWAGLEPGEFELYTTYENAHYCKPNPKYYEEILEKIGCRAAECLMVGNDVEEDMVAETLGMKVFLLTDCMINKQEKDISVYENGGFAQLEQFIEKSR